jgi:hypothetical protein
MKQQKLQLEIMLELVEFSEECLRKIYNITEHEAERAIAILKDNIRNFYDMGCINSLSCIDHNLKAEAKHREEYRKQHEKELAKKSKDEVT